MTKPTITGAPVSAGPVRTGGPPESWKHRPLYDRVIDSLHALPSRFRTKLRIAGVAATDLFTLNTPLGAAIEQNVVENLNDLRPIWDPKNEYQQYTFVRQPQAFPDVRLQTTAPGVAEPIIMGIELKGWFVLAKEGEPSFRYKASPAVCQPQDLIVVFPWQLDEVISGAPQLMQPFIEEARFAAEHRNHYWEHSRGAANSGVILAANTAAYPAKADRFNDEAASDKGSNFGRVARGGLMTSFIAGLMQEPMAGIPAKHWQAFLKAFADGATDEAITKRTEAIRREVAGIADPDDAALRTLDGLLELIRQRGA